MPYQRKTGVLTFHRCINYGSYWQARCLVEALQEMDCDPVLLNHNSARVNRREWRCALSPQLPTRSLPEDRTRNANKIRKFESAIRDLPQSPRFPLEAPDCLDSLDVILVGSDEVWNLSHPWYGGFSAFFGRGLNTERLASYAASFGSRSASEGLPKIWREALTNFSAISVRDSNSRTIVRDVLGRDPQLVLDPCLLHPPCEASGHPIEQPTYLAVYGHSFPDWFASAVKTSAVDEGYRIISIGYRNDWADEQRIDADPHEFARLMAGASAVASNFFHGSVFALLNEKPFVCVSSAYRANKLADLMALFSTEMRMLNERTAPRLAHTLLIRPLESHVSHRMVNLRAQSQQFLQQAVAP